MNSYYTHITVDGIPTLLEVHYEVAENRVTILEFYDRHGDDPGLSQEQVYELAFEIKEFESNRPLQNAEQQNLAMQFQFPTAVEL